MVAAGSTTFSLSSLATTASLSRETTDTCENSALSGFQHLVHPHAWLWALWLRMDTATLRSGHLQYSVPPAKLAAAGLMPLSIEGWMLTAMFDASLGRNSLGYRACSLGGGPVRHPPRTLWPCQPRQVDASAPRRIRPPSGWIRR